MTNRLNEKWTVISGLFCAAGLVIVFGGAAMISLPADASGNLQGPPSESVTTQPAGVRLNADSPPESDEVEDDDENAGRQTPARRRSKRDLVDPELLEELSGGKSSAKDAVEETVSRMRQASQRIAADHDVGRETRRIQKEILSGLDAMIEAAERSAASSKQNPSARRKTARPRKDDRPQQQDRKSRAGSANRRGGGTTERGGQAIENKDRPDRTDLARRWGFLPEQEREALLQGLDESFMPKYRDEITRYYQNLAIEASRE